MGCSGVVHDRLAGAEHVLVTVFMYHAGKERERGEGKNGEQCRDKGRHEGRLGIFAAALGVNE